jgi:hypothetical protein
MLSWTLFPLCGAIEQQASKQAAAEDTWQAADLDDTFETMLWASDEVSVKVFKEYAKRCCWFVL